MSEHNEQITVPAKDILNIFQLFNEEVFGRIDNENEAEGIYANVVKMFARLQAQNVDVLIDNDDLIETYSSSIKGSHADGFITSTAIERTCRTEEPEQWLFISIGKTVDLGEHITKYDDRYKLKPLFVLSGKIENNCDFIVHDCIAKVETKDGEEIMKPNSLADFHAMMLYANTAFLSVMKDIHMDIDSFMKHIADPSELEKATEGYNKIKPRTGTDLSGILQFSKPSMAAADSFFINPMSPSLQ